MVERLKEAVEKARRAREAALAGASPYAAAAPDAPLLPATAPALWRELTEATPPQSTMEERRIVACTQSSPAQASFDVLRTRLIRAAREHNWRRIGVTSAQKGSGKTFVVANLGHSLVRGAELRVLMMDLDLRNPSLGRTLGVAPPASAPQYLRGEATLAQAVVRVGVNLAVMAGARTANSAELLHSGQTVESLAALETALEPDLTLFDLPPIFASDDVLGFLGCLDALVVVAAAGQTTAATLREALALIDGQTTLAGVVMNKVERAETQELYYDYNGVDG